MEEELFALLKEKNYHLCSIESLTGGKFGAYITSIPGASKIYKGGMITYLNEVKEKLGVSHKTLETEGAVSSSTAYEMVKEGARFFSSEVAISFTGNAGPTAMENKEVGLAYIGIAIDSKIEVFEYHIKKSREEIRDELIKEGIKKLVELLKNN